MRRRYDGDVAAMWRRPHHNQPPCGGQCHKHWPMSHDWCNNDILTSRLSLHNGKQTIMQIWTVLQTQSYTLHRTHPASKDIRVAIHTPIIIFFTQMSEGSVQCRSWLVSESGASLMGSNLPGPDVWLSQISSPGKAKRYRPPLGPLTEGLPLIGPLAVVYRRSTMRPENSGSLAQWCLRRYPKGP